MPPDDAPLLNLLVAYPYMNDQVVRLIASHQSTTRFVLDSGAFTAWKAGKPIALDDYCRYIESLTITPWRYFTLDVVGDPEASMRNYETMLARGFKPVPIFTRGEDPAVLDHYYATSDVVGIGGLVGTPNNKAFVNGIMRHVGKRRAHWLGFTMLTFIKQYRPYMCDSSSWMMSARWAQLRLYMGHGRTKLVGKVAHFQTRPSTEIVEVVRSYGIDPAALAKDVNWSGQRSLSRILSAASAIRESLDIQRVCGTLAFLATTTSGYAEILMEALDRGMVRPSIAAREKKEIANA